MLNAPAVKMLTASLGRTVNIAEAAVICKLGLQTCSVPSQPLAGIKCGICSNRHGI